MPLSNLGSGFFWKNLLKGAGFVGLIIILYLIARRFMDIDAVMSLLGQWPALMYLTFSLSEIIFGLIPPELFIIWVIDHGIMNQYIPDVFILALISFMAGVIGYHLGKASRDWPVTRTFMEKNVLKYNDYYRKYGGFLVVIGAMTPLPFSAVCMLMGATLYPYGRFLLLAAIRFLRFALYAWAIWKTIGS